MPEKLSPYIPEGEEDQGRVRDANIAHGMANVEDGYHIKTPKILKPIKKVMEKLGDRAAEKSIERGGKTEQTDLPQAVKDEIYNLLNSRYSSERDSGRLRINDIDKIEYGNGEEKYRINGTISTNLGDSISKERAKIEIEYKDGKVVSTRRL